MADGPRHMTGSAEIEIMNLVIDNYFSRHNRWKRRKGLELDHRITCKIISNNLGSFHGNGAHDETDMQEVKSSHKKIFYYN